MDSSRDFAYYKQHAKDVRLEDITSSERNKEIIQKLRDNDSDFEGDGYLHILDESGDNNYYDTYEFKIEADTDLGWLGYFIGQNERLENLCIDCDLPRENALIKGICLNRSIKCIDLACDIGDDQHSLVASLLENNLESIDVRRFAMTNVDKFAAELGKQCWWRQSLQSIQFSSILLSDTEASYIATALSAQPQLETLEFEGNNLGGTRFCTNLATTFVKWGDKSQLRELLLTRNEIDDEGLQKISMGLASCRSLTHLDLSSNEFSAGGLAALASVFQTDNCSLTKLTLTSLGMDDDGAKALASGLVDYKLLKCLNLSWNAIGDEGLASLAAGLVNAVSENLETLDLTRNDFSIAGIRSLSTLLSLEKSKLRELSIGENSICIVGKSTLAEALVNNTSLECLGDCDVSRNDSDRIFSTLLCDSSSISNIYASNHTLASFSSRCNPKYGSKVEKYVNLNMFLPKYRHLIPVIKVLMNYPDLGDMTPFYRWKLKLLPFVVDWFERARICRGYLQESETKFQRRELSGVYKFVRGVPQLVTRGYWSGRLKHVRVQKRKLEEEQEQLRERKRKLEGDEMHSTNVTMQFLDRLA